MVDDVALKKILSGNDELRFAESDKNLLEGLLEILNFSSIIASVCFL